VTRVLASLLFGLAAAAVPTGPSFGEREVSRYQMRWLSGPVAVSAGDVNVTAERTSGGYRLALELRTASWAKALYEAVDVFETHTDAALLPLTHRQDLADGRKHIVRTVEFDRRSRRVRVTSSGGPPSTLPLTASARDPLATLFYVRTLPLDKLDRGSRQQFVVNDAGREFPLDVRVIGPEPVTVNGRAQDAIRLEPRFAAGGERPEIHAVVWVSRDARRVPLSIAVTTSVGSFGLELVDYQAR